MIIVTALPLPFPPLPLLALCKAIRLVPPIRSSQLVVDGDDYYPLLIIWELGLQASLEAGVSLG